MVEKKAKIYNREGGEAGQVVLPEEIFGLPWNADLVHQVVYSMLSNARTGTAHAKDRSEVRGGGKKPYRQKGTGRARHGSTRSPIWVGGGVTHGPVKDKNYSKKVNKKMKNRAFFVALSRKLRDGEILFLDKMDIKDKPSTKIAKGVLDSLSSIKGFEGILKKRKNAALIVLNNNDRVIKTSFNNFNNLDVVDIKNINPVDLLSFKYIVITDPGKTIDSLKDRLEKKSSVKQ